MIKTIYQGWNGAEIQDDSEQGGEMEVSDTLSRVYPVRTFELCGFKCTHTYGCTFISSPSNRISPYHEGSFSFLFLYFCLVICLHIYERALTMYPGLTSNSHPFCPSLPRAGIIGICLCAWHCTVLVLQVHERRTYQTCINIFWF